MAINSKQLDAQTLERLGAAGPRYLGDHAPYSARDNSGVEVPDPEPEAEFDNTGNDHSLPLADAKDQALAWLMDGPRDMYVAQRILDHTEAEYRSRLVYVSIHALSEQTFVGKDGQHRAASNDTERELAIQNAVANDPILIGLSMTYLDAKREVAALRNTVDAAHDIVKLLSC